MVVVVVVDTNVVLLVVYSFGHGGVGYLGGCVGTIGILGGRV